MAYSREEHANQLKDGYVRAIANEMKDESEPAGEGFDGYDPNLPGDPIEGRDMTREETGVLPQDRLRSPYERADGGIAA